MFLVIFNKEIDFFLFLIRSNIVNRLMKILLKLNLCVDKIEKGEGIIFFLVIEKGKILNVLVMEESGNKNDLKF